MAITKNIAKLLLQNIGIRQTILKNTIWLVFAEAVSRFANLFLLAYVARGLGVSEYGKFTFAFSFATLMAMGSNMGVIDVATREFSRDRENEKKLGDIMGLEAVLSFFVASLSFIVSFFITNDPAIRKLLWILTFFILCNSFLGILFAFLRARQKMEHEAGIKFFQAFSTVAIVLGIVFIFPSAINLSYGYLLANALVLAGALWYFHFHFQHLHVRFKKASLEVLKISWPLSFGLTLGWTYISINSILLGYFGFIIENGWYNAASRVALVAIVPATLIVRSFYPALSRFFMTSKQSFQNTWNHLQELMILIAVPMVVGGVLLSHRIIYAFYGSEFAPSAPALQLFILMAGISFVNYPYSIVLVVTGNQKINFFLIASGALLNILLTILLLEAFGFYGAIVSIIIAALAVLAGTIFFTTKFSLVNPFNKVSIKVSCAAAFAALAMFFAINQQYANQLNIMIVIMIGAFVYGISLYVLYQVIFPQRIALLWQWKSF